MKSLINASVINLVSKISRISFTLLSTVFFARYVSLTDFGVFAIIMIPMQIMMPYLESGFSNVLYKNNDLKLNSILHLLGKFIAFFIIIIYFLTYYILSLNFDFTFDYIVFILIIFYIFSLSNSVVPKALLFKNEQFKWVMWIEIIAVAISTIIAVILAYFDFGLYALLTKLSLDALIQYLIFYRVSYQPSKFADLKLVFLFKKHIYFGLRIALSRSLTGFTELIDKMYLTAFFPVNIVGAFSFIKSIAVIPDQSIRPAISGASFVYLGKTNDPKEKEKIVLSLENLVLMLIIIPLSLLVNYSDIIVDLFLGNKWLEYHLILKSLSYLSIGLVFKSIINVSLVDSKRTVLLNKLFLIDFAIVTFAFFNIYYYNILDLLLLSKIFALSRLSYWLLLYIIFSLTNKLYSNKLYLLKFTVLTYLLCYTFYYLNLNLNPILEIVLYLSLVISFPLFNKYFFNREL